MLKTYRPEPVQDLTRFIISFRGGGFLNRAGSSQDDCKTTTAFALSSGGQLSLADDPDSVFSAYATDDSIAFVPSKPAKPIAIIWTFDNVTLSWKNAAFLNGVATFCGGSAGVTAYLRIPPPSDCNSLEFVGEDSKQPHTTVC